MKGTHIRVSRQYEYTCTFMFLPCIGVHEVTMINQNENVIYCTRILFQTIKALAETNRGTPRIQIYSATSIGMISIEECLKI